MDGSWKEGKGGVGVIVRNSLGSVVFYGIFPILAAISPLHIKTLAALKGLEVVAAFQVHVPILKLTV